VNVFIHQCGVNTFLPILTPRDFKFVEGGVFDLNLTSVLTMVSNLLLMSTTGQDTFSGAGGFEILSTLIRDHWINQFMLKVYQSLMLLMELLQCESLQWQLFLCILTCIPLLMEFEADLHVRILQWWGNALFVSFNQLAKQFWRTEAILALLKAYYRYDATDPALVQYRNSRLNVAQSRTQLLKILWNYFMELFDRHDYQTLVSFTVGMSEVQEGEELSVLLCRVVEELPENVDFLLEGHGPWIWKKTKTFKFRI
jgi:hypothetical protein